MIKNYNSRPQKFWIIKHILNLFIIQGLEETTQNNYLSWVRYLNIYIDMTSVIWLNDFKF